MTAEQTIKIHFKRLKLNQKNLCLEVKVIFSYIILDKIRQKTFKFYCLCLISVNSINYQLIKTLKYLNLVLKLGKYGLTFIKYLIENNKFFYF